MVSRLTEEQCFSLFERLFPKGLDDSALVQELAPEGWERSELVRVSHPTAEQVYAEALRFREGLRRLRGEAASHEDEPLLTLEGVREEMQNETVKPAEECADLIGRCLWDIFAENHDVLTSDGMLVDLGSFRGAAGFIANFRDRRAPSESWPRDSSNYLDFYMGTTLIRDRANLMPVYEMIFRRMRRLGMDWRYVLPRLMLVDLCHVFSDAETKSVPEAIRYDPTENYWRGREEATKQAETAEIQQVLDEGYRESVEQARNEPPPGAVEAYRRVYGCWPKGWPPDIDAEPDVHDYLGD